MTKVFESTAFFALCLFAFVAGAILAAKILGTYLQPVSNSLGTALQAA